MTFTASFKNVPTLKMKRKKRHGKPHGVSYVCDRNIAFLDGMRVEVCRYRTTPDDPEHTEKIFRQYQPSSPPLKNSRPPHRTQRLSCQNTPKIRTAHVWVLGAILPLVLLVFYGDFLRIPLEFCCSPTDFQTCKFPHFFLLLTSQKPQKHWIFWLPPGSPIFHQIPLSSEIPDTLEMR